IHALYVARGKGEAPATFTVPAINIRGLAYDTARALFRARRALDAGAVICEIARSEITYTDQRPAEYAFVVVAAALREGWRGPVFLQGDHFQVNAKKYAGDPEGEVRAVRELTAEAIQAGFHNIDVDTSTLVDLSKQGHEAQQAANGGRCAELTAFVREREARGGAGSVGGETGEGRREQSPPAELTAADARNPAARRERLARSRSDQQDLDPDRHVPRRCPASRRVDRPGADRLRCAREVLGAGPRKVRNGGRGPARRLHPAGFAVRPLPAARHMRDPF